MLRLVGCMLILSGGGMACFIGITARKHCIDCLDSMVWALREVEREIRINLRPIPLLIDRMRKTEQPQVSRFFGKVKALLDAGEELTCSWRASVAELELPEHCQNALDKLGDVLSADEQSVTAALQLTIEQLSAELNLAEKNERQEQRKISVCGMSAAVFLIILLI